MSTSDEEHLPKPGEMVAGKYRVEKIIGKGGMGAVLAAHHELLGQNIAIKFLLGEIAQNPEAVQRFNNEARNAFKIQSEHVCRIMDVGEHKGMPFMVMEYLRGGDLSQMVEQRGALPLGEAIDYVLQALEAIAQAHAQGIVHRDLKPANLFLHQRSDGSMIVKVLDFGIAKASNPFGEGGNHSLTSTKAMLGSPLYMSPEQLRSAKNVDARSDIWALGVILYELLTGTVPFNGETLGELFIAILEQPPIAINQRRPDVPAALNDVIMRCLMRGADQRFQNVAELAEALLPFAPARSTSSAERIAQALGKQLSPNAGYRSQQASYVGGAMQGPSPTQQTGNYGPPPATGSGFANTGSGAIPVGPPGAGGVPAGSGQTNAAWAGSGQVPTSKAPIFVAVGVLGLLVLAGGGFGIYKVTHSGTGPVGTGTGEVPTVSATSTNTSSVGTSTASTPTATTTASTPTATTTTTTTTTAPTATHTGTMATGHPTGTGTVKPPPSATVTATAPSATVTATATHTATAPTSNKKAKGAVCASGAECASGKCTASPFDRNSFCD
jgi:serine/threonine-protein kinase